MVKYYHEQLDHTFFALSDPTRRAILARLARGSSQVTDVAEQFDISLPAVSKHLKILEKAGLLKREKDGRIHNLSLIPEPLQEADEWLAFYRKFWEDRLDALADYIHEMKDNEIKQKENRNK